LALEEGFVMPHSSINPKTRKRAQSLRREITKAERLMWDLLREFRPDGAHFRREAPIAPYIADFAWLSAKFIIEVDGDSHETERAKRHDEVRDAFLRSEGFQILRFDNDDMSLSIDYVHAQITEAITLHLTDDKNSSPSTLQSTPATRTQNS